ncbi:FIST N-terminal domain-containing protein [Pseudooceanicola aestuarii]|uniref:FIST N-terminal domain-containing protein n=1 Tax=Pseudooceanicola aestuarii TaxID=2697319 RepID=UPI0013D44BE1|nr:FIST N-terminal domain-containing protein [Pseudooceanicola aestuarii]
MHAGAGPTVTATAAARHVLTHAADCTDPDGLPQIARAFAGRDMALVVFFVSPLTDFAATMRQADSLFPGCRTIGCTTGGEIAGDGYAEGRIVAVGFPAADFIAEPVLLRGLRDLDRQALIADMIRRRARLAATRPDWRGEFGLLLVDGMTLMEDRVAAACADALGPVQMFGGSAGDGTRFEWTAVAMDGVVHRDAAVLTSVRTRCRVRVFSINHLTPTDQRVVVTSADPSRRLVHEINAEPAAREYARLLGKDPEQLDTFTFAAHPVAVRFGGQHQVRAIQKVGKDGALVFFSAIEEGLVLSLATPAHMATHLDRELSALRDDGPPDTILACDCILRRMEAQEKQQMHAVSAVLRDHGVVGFSTYGEQMGGMHVNQTMTGLALYPPERPARW